VEFRTSGTPPANLGTLAVAVVIVVGLYFGREVFVPMALAILLSFALGPPVLLLRRWHLGRVPALIGVVVLAFLIIGGIGAFVGTQLTWLGICPNTKLISRKKSTRCGIRRARVGLSTVPQKW
jgi:predicted PurR-regulated permease PerM